MAPGPRPARAAAATPGIAFIGAGSFAQKFLIPFAKDGGQLVSVVTARGVSAKGAREKFGFASCSTDPQHAFADADVNTVFIATRHDTHASLAIAALEAGKNVFVEKPLAILEEDLARVLEAARRRPDVRLMVGYNRRFSPLAVQARKVFAGLPAPLVMTYRINAGLLPMEHWTQTDQGGGRILGEVCHFVDLMQFVTGSEPVSVYAASVDARDARMPDHDNVAIAIRFRNGSVGQITYLACGDKAVSKERLEIFGGGQSFVIDDFRSGEHYAEAPAGRSPNPARGTGKRSTHSCGLSATDFPRRLPSSRWLSPAL